MVGILIVGLQPKLGVARMVRVPLAFLTVIVVVGPLVGDENWPQFRGPSAGLADGPSLPDQWSTSKNVIWKTDVPGRGWSSPIVWGERIFLTAVVNDGKSEEPKKGLYFGGDRPKPSTDLHHWLVLCLDWKTGKKLWQREVHKGVPSSPIHLKNSYASETPVTDGERVYAYFGNVGLFCFDLDGKELWSKEWGNFKMRLGWGTAASPVLHKGRLYLVNDNDEKSFVMALDAKSGQEIWRVERDEKSNWATPFVWEHPGRTELVTCGTNRVRSYNLDGKLLWELDGMSSITIPTPFARLGLLYVTSGYILDKKKPLFAIQPGASGDISLKPDETSNNSIAWCQKMAGPYNPTPLVHGDLLYVLYDTGLLACYDARTGKVIYDKQRLGSRAGFTASPWVCGNKVYCLNEDGETYVVQAGPEFKLLATNNLDEMCMATPAVVRGNLLIRTQTKLYRIGQAE
jgi:outer membrane protein assembly factor BamB